MKIRVVGADLFNEKGRTDGQTWWSKESLFVILRTHLKMTLCC